MAARKKSTASEELTDPVRTGNVEARLAALKADLATLQADMKGLYGDVSEVASERAALAKRFALVSIARLEAGIELERSGDQVDARGTLEAEFVQSCAVSGEDVPVTIREPLSLRFVPAEGATASEEEVPPLSATRPRLAEDARCRRQM